MVGPLMFERPEETFHNRVVVATSGVAHGAGHAEGAERLLVEIAGVLASSVAVMQEFAGIRPSCFHGVSQGLADQWRGQAVADRPANDLATE